MSWLIVIISAVIFILISVLIYFAERKSLYLKRYLGFILILLGCIGIWYVFGFGYPIISINKVLNYNEHVYPLHFIISSDLILFFTLVFILTYVIINGLLSLKKRY